MAIPLLTRDKKEIALFGSEAQQAVLSGKVTFAPKSRVSMIDPEGTRYSAPAESTFELFQRGWRLPTEAEEDRQRFRGETGKATAEAVARGFSAGLSDPLLVAAGVPKENLQGRKDFNPTQARYGELAGVGLGMVGGAGSLFAKAGGAVAARTALAGGLVSGGVQGGLWGVSSIVNKEFFGEQMTTAEKLMTVVGTTALGALAGSAGSKLDQRFAKHFKGIKPEQIKADLQKLATFANEGPNLSKLSPFTQSMIKGASKVTHAMNAVSVKPLDFAVSMVTGNPLAGVATAGSRLAIRLASRTLAGNGHKVLGAALPEAQNLLFNKQNAAHLVSLLVGKLNNPQMAVRLASGLQRMAERSSAGVLQNVLPAMAAQMDPLTLLGSHVRRAQEDPDYLPLAGFMPEQAQDEAGIADMTARASAIMDVVDEVDARVDSIISDFINGKSRKGKATPVNTEALYNDSYVALSQSPTYMDVGEHLSGFPNLAHKLLQIRQQALAMMATKIPQNPYPVVSEQLGTQWKPDRLSLSRWGRYVEATLDPIGALEGMRDHSISPEAIEAIQTVYPRLHQEIYLKTMSELAESGKRLTFQQRNLVRRMFGGIEQYPQRLATMQGLYESKRKTAAQAGQSRMPGGPPPSEGIDGRQEVSQTKNYQTQMQRIEGRAGRPPG